MVYVIISLDLVFGGLSIGVPSLAASQASLGNEVAVIFSGGIQTAD
jgi:hypothetical protein